MLIQKISCCRKKEARLERGPVLKYVRDVERFIVMVNSLLQVTEGARARAMVMCYLLVKNELEPIVIYLRKMEDYFLRFLS